MKNKAIMKMCSSSILVMCLLISIFAPSIGVLAENTNSVATTMDFPAPVFKENPQYFYEIAKPEGVVDTSFSEEFNPDLVSDAAGSAPVISGITKMASPNDSVTLQGEGFSGGKVWVYGLDKKGEGMFTVADITHITDTTVNAIISEKYDYSLYMVWVESAAGILSRPALVNKAESNWISEDTASPGASLYFYGKNLTTDNADGDDCVSYIYLTNGGKAYKAEITDANPYRVTFTVPEGIADGEYKVWAHNGHGGQYGWSDPLALTIENGVDNLWAEGEEHIHEVSNVGELKDAINSAADRDTILVKNGVYQLDNVIEVKKELRFMGESKEGVKFICSPPSYTISSPCTFKVVCYPSEFRNISFEDDVNDFATHGIENATCMFIYAWGYQAKQLGNAAEDLYLRVENCEFKVNRLYDGVHAESGERDEAVVAMLKEKYPYYSGSDKHRAPLYIDQLEDVYINNCHFVDGYGASIHYCNKVIFTNNTSAGNWVMYGSSASALAAFFSCNNTDVSNNKVYGIDYLNGIEYELYGLGFDRCFVFQMPTTYHDNCYVADNDFRGVGEEGGNAGETILFEHRGKIYTGGIDAISSNGQVITFTEPIWVGIDGNKNNAFENNEYWHYSMTIGGTTSAKQIMLGATVWVMGGKGQSQYRKIVDVTENSLVLDRPFDIVPAVKGEENESFVMICGAMTNTSVFRNNLVGLKYYARTFNASTAIQGYATLLNYTVDRNDFSRLHTGIYCDMAFDVRHDETDSGYSGFADAMVLNNRIADVRDGIDVNLSLGGMSNDNSVNESVEMPPLGHISNGLVVRNNKITNCNYAYNAYKMPDGTIVNSFAERHPSGVSVGTVLRRFSIWSYSEFWFGDWIKGTVIENNYIFDTENAYIRLRNHQGSTIVRNNYCGGNGDEGDITTKDIQPVDWYPEVESAITYNNYGNFEEGIYGTVSNLESFDELQNGNFAEGLKYWASNYGKGYASDYASIVDGAVKVGSKIGITSVDFKPQNIPVNSKVAVVYDWKGSENVRVELTGYGLQTVSKDKLTTFANSDVKSGWNRSINNYTLTTTEDLDLNVVIYSLDGTSAQIDNIEFVIVNEEQGYYETVDGNRYNLLDGSVYGGSADKGITTKNADDIHKYGYTKGLANGSFEDGLKFWKLSGTATSTISANSGKVVFSSTTRTNGIISAPFKVEVGEFTDTTNRAAIMLEYNSATNNSSGYVVNLYETIDGNTEKYILSGKIGTNITGETYLLGAFSKKTSTASAVSWKNNAVYNIEILSTKSALNCELTEVKLARYDEVARVFVDYIDDEMYINNATTKQLESATSISNSAVAKELKNGDFSDGTSYWYGNATVTDGKLTANEDVTSLGFKVKADAGTRLAVMFDYTATADAKVTFNGGSTTAKEELTAGSSGTAVTETIDYSSAYSYKITLSAGATYDNIRVVTPNAGGTYTDTITGEVYDSNCAILGGTYEDGFYSAGDNVGITLDTHKNLDFSEGFKYWTSKSDRDGNASKYASLNGDGSVTIAATANYDGIASMKAKLLDGRVGITYKITFETLGDIGVNLRVFSSTGSKPIDKSSTASTEWITTVTYTATTTVQDESIYLDFQITKAGSRMKIRNIKVLCLDAGGLGLYLNSDGTPVEAEYGDVNVDGRIDLADLVAVKRYAAGGLNNIYIAAANIDRDENISVTASDIAMIHNYVLTGKKEF